MLDVDVIDAFRARAKDTGRGYQTAINKLCVSTSLTTAWRPRFGV